MKKAYFLADLHLGASNTKTRLDEERQAVAFLDKIAADASEIFLMGDILDYWFEYKHVAPRGFVRFLGKLAMLADMGIKITWLIGNHDIWIFDYIPEELNVEVIDGMVERDVLGHRFSLQHGDAIGGNRKFRWMRAVFRNRFCQKLYGAIHPRWTVGFAFNCSRKSRNAKLKEDYKPVELLPAIERWCNSRIAEGDKAEYFVMGHLHRSEKLDLDDGRKLIILPPWMVLNGYGVFDGTDFRIEYFSNNS